MDARVVTLIVVLFLTVAVSATDDARQFGPRGMSHLFGESVPHRGNESVVDDELFGNMGVMVPMSDGVELYTIVSFPLITLPHKRYPVVLDRTPYGADGVVVTLGLVFHSKGYIAVAQDMRGRYKSQGEFDYWRMSGQDGYDTVQWITEQSWSNGQVFGFGISADGIAGGCMEINDPPPPALKALSLAWATSDVYASTYNNGAYRESLISGWLTELGEGWMITDVQAHEAYGPWWSPIDMSTQWNNSNIPILHTGGWYDIFAGGTVQSFLGMQYHGGPGAKGNQLLIVNALGHCTGGEYDFPGTSNDWPFQVTWDMFEQAQSSQPYSAKTWPVCLYVMGPDPATMTSTDAGNFWSCMDEFPPFVTQTLYLNDGGKLEPSVGSQWKNQSYVYDPSNPVPTLGGPNLLLPTCGPYDQTQLESRDDVLVFTSAVLQEAVTVTGHVNITLYVSSSANDTDFTAKITDVYNGKSYNVLDNIIRMRWRDSSTNITLMHPGTVYEVTIDMLWVSYVFNVGHQIRVDISSSNYPRFSTNLNNGNTLSEGGSPVKATNTVYYSTTFPSRLNLPTVSLSSLQAASRTPWE